jgi:hypothetical protein
MRKSTEKGTPMTFEDIIQDFAWSDEVPVEAVQAALASPVSFVDQAIPLLDRIAQSTSNEHEERALAVLVQVLAEIGDERAFLPLMRLLRMRSDDRLELFGDILTETMGNVLISLTSSQVTKLEEALNDADLDEYVRDAIFETWTRLALTGVVTRESARAFLTEYPVRVGLDKSDYGWSSWMYAATILGFSEMRDFAKEHMRNEDDIAAIMEGTLDSFQDFDEELTESLADPDRWKDNPRYQPVTSAIDQISDWHSYSEEYRSEQASAWKNADDGDWMFEDKRGSVFSEPATNPYKDVGRNDPCPCGSGKKFKKCCLNKDGLAVD